MPIPWASVAEPVGHTRDGTVYTLPPRAGRPRGGVVGPGKEALRRVTRGRAGVALRVSRGGRPGLRGRSCPWSVSPALQSDEVLSEAIWRTVVHQFGV